MIGADEHLFLCARRVLLFYKEFRKSFSFYIDSKKKVGYNCVYKLYTVITVKMHYNNKESRHEKE